MRHTLKLVAYVYLENTSNPQYNKLGRGYILLVPEENEIVFTVEDSAGKTGQFVVENKLYRDIGYKPEIDYSKFLPAKEEGRKYLPDMLILMTEDIISYEEVEEMVASIGGEVISRLYEKKYYIQVPESTEDELLAMCAKLEKKYKKKISYVEIYYIGSISLNS